MSNEEELQEKINDIVSNKFKSFYDDLSYSVAEKYGEYSNIIENAIKKAVYFEAKYNYLNRFSEISQDDFPAFERIFAIWDSTRSDDEDECGRQTHGCVLTHGRPVISRAVIRVRRPAGKRGRGARNGGAARRSRAWDERISGKAS